MSIPEVRKGLIQPIHRRRLLQGAAVAAGGAAIGSVATESPVLAAKQSAGLVSRYPFHGAHQAGVLDERQPSAAFVACDVTARTTDDLVRLMRILTSRARFLMHGGVEFQPGIAAPPPDSGILGPDVPPDGLTVTLGLGASLFDGRYGLASSKPVHLRRMDTFVNDHLDRAICDGDILLQICANDSDTVVHALRDISRQTRGLLQPRWRIDGFVPPPRPTGTPRNLMGFKDGTANPDTSDPAQMSALVWVQAGSGEPDWAVGGSYHVVRVIRMLVEFWDRVAASEQERMIGRRKDTGAPMSGRVEHDVPDYSDDPTGAVTPLDSHIRVANPRTRRTADSRILRRSFNYDAGIDANGNLDMGLIFSCFQQDLDRQFVTIQRRLADEPLVDYISPVGGGYFFAVPGVTSAHDFYASALLA